MQRNEFQKIANIEEIKFEIDHPGSNTPSVDLEKDSSLMVLSPIAGWDEGKKSESRLLDFLINDEEELDLKYFEDNFLKFIFDDASTLTIKATRTKKFSDDALTRLERVSNKLSSLNKVSKTEEKTTLCKKIYSALVGKLRSTNKILKHKRITKLVVDFTNCENLGDQGLSFLIDFIKHFENLTSLDFEVKHTGATDLTLGRVSSLLKDLKNLHSFYVDFSGCSVSDEGVFYLANLLSSKVTLKEIWLRFSWCPEEAISNEALQTISKALKACKKLRVLLLEFNGQIKISSKGASEIMTAIEGKKSLRKLYLYFEKSQVNDNFLDYAGKVLPKFRKLEVFGLNLANSQFITLKGLQKLEKGLKSLGSLKNGLYLYLNGCLGSLDSEKMKKSICALVEKKKIKNHVIEFQY